MSAALPLIGHKLVQERFLAAKQSGRLHHGWILQGPSGVGKALFAKRLAALMLGAEAVDASAEDSVMQKVISGSHPDLKWLTRGLNDKGQLRQDITVGQIRDLNKFFALRPALAGWRVGVIDALDETNVSGLNALLKTLEEPPQNAILLLISHGTKPLLTTIRSRCQILRLNALSDDETTQVLNNIGANDKLVAALAHGRPGYGLALKESGGAAAVQAARTMLSSIRKPESGVFAQALKAASVDNGSLAAFTDTILAWTAKRAEDNPALGQTWLALHEVRATAAELNLTPLQTAAKLLATLQDGVKMLPASA